MATILEALKAQLDGNPTTIAEAIDIISGSSTSHARISSAIAELGLNENVAAYIISFSANGGSGTVDPIACSDGSTVTLPAGTGLTPPKDKVFVGWSEENDADAKDAILSYAATEAVTLYAVWDDET